MAFDGKVMRRAQLRFEADKQRRADEFARRREMLYRAEPELQQIEQQLRGTVSKIIADAIRNGTDPNPAIRVIKDENMELQRRRAAWVCPEPKIKTGYLARYAKLVSSADKGAILQG